ncbi:MAG: hypothetical protein EP297_09090 [Gammaproteobacteria bacterium]|nr:MAG: hypothetical protein EP297_09090 [Gammaproteobacteria bacterium]
MPGMFFQALLSGVLLITLFNASASEADFTNPEFACSLLSDHRLRTSGWSKRLAGQQYECRSHYREFLTSGRLKNRIRYIAHGSVDLVNMLRLELQIRARRDVQRAHRHLLEYTSIILDKILDAEVPDDMKDAILAGIKGDWHLKTVTLSLSRFSLDNALYELHLTIYPGTKP